MGGLWIEAASGKRYPVSWFGRSDTKWLLEILTDAPFLPVCSHVFGLDLQPLEKIETDWLTFNLGSAMWQQPQTVIACAQSLAAALTTMPNVFATLEAERQRCGLDFLNLSGFEDEEMTSGASKQSEKAVPKLRSSPNAKARRASNAPGRRHPQRPDTTHEAQATP